MFRLRSLSIVAVLSLAAGLMLMAASKPTKTALVRLTVTNHSHSEMILRLVGPKKYTLSVDADEKKVFTVHQGDYYYEVKACGVTADSTIDLTRHKKLVMPVCGGSVPHAESSDQIVDLSSHIRLVKISLENLSSTRTLAFFTGPSTYVFTVDGGEKKELTVAKGDYTVRYYGCGTSDSQVFDAVKDSVLTLSCP